MLCISFVCLGVWLDSKELTTCKDKRFATFLHFTISRVLRHLPATTFIALVVGGKFLPNSSSASADANSKGKDL